MAKNITPFPSFDMNEDDPVAEPIPLSASEEPLPKDQEEPPNGLLQEFLDQYTPPFQPQPAPVPPAGPQKTPSTHLTQPYGLTMAMFLDARSRRPPPGRPGTNEVPKGSIITNQPEALRQALNYLGVASGRNPNGLTIDISTARQVIFGKGDIDEVEEAEFRARMEAGDIQIDKKKIRQFVNYDGSVTYEILNNDKSILSRFTIGEFKGQKLFVQGGYSVYAQSMRAVIEKMSSIQVRDSEFDKVRERLNMGGR